MKLWLVSRFVGGVWDERKQEYGVCEFEIVGVYDSEEKALAVCTTDKHVIAPMELNYTFPDERVIIPGSYYPLAKKETMEVQNEKETADK